VQVQVHHVYAKIAGPHLAHQRVHVGTVHVKQTALGVHDLRDLVDLLLEDAQRVGIGQHEGGDVVIHLCFEGCHLHHAASIRLQISTE